jgi:predicted transcriptional regulator
VADERQYRQDATVVIRPKPAQQSTVAKILPPLTEAQHAHIKKTIATVKEKMPEIIPMIKELHDLGMIDGWRSVTIKEVKNNG